ncbi:MAG: D-alanine--D-alanine ligase [Proteobacteria bacterium]|nr:D-alanine--D-alanine ligase [Pseudomonadota bacterium]MBI3496577.1 D-alanine--D-alanine ligase [Pseudomonadota bacterium]
MSKHVAVLMGGWSSEREVSLVSGRECAKALRQGGFQVSEIDVGRDIALVLDRMRPEICFNALHGRFGEDGRIQGLLDIMGIPYTHSGALASAIAMDKVQTKHLCGSVGVPMAEGKVVRRREAFGAMPAPFVVKPISEGSSVGVRIVRNGDNRAPDEDWRYGDDVLVEEFIPGRELTVGVMGDRPLAVTEIKPKEAFFDYTAKYTEGRAVHLVPAPLPSAVYEETLRVALLAHQTIGCRGVTRSDFRYDDTTKSPGRLVFLEINTQPGMTPLSLVPEQAAYHGISFTQLVTWMVEEARCDS